MPPPSRRDFRLLWAGEAVSALGSQFSILAVPTLAILRLGAGPIQVGVLTGLGFAGYPVAALGAGPFIDRLRRRPVLLAANAMRAAVLTGVVLAALGGRVALWELGGAALLLSGATAVFDAAYQVLLPVLLPTEHLGGANARLETSQSVAAFAGPSLAGFVIQAAGAAVALLADAASYVVAFVSVLMVRTDTSSPRTTPMSFRHDLTDGVRAFRTYRFLTPLVTCVAVSNAGGMMVRSLLLLAVYRAFDLSAADGGWILAAGGLAGVVGATAAAAAGRRLGVGRAMLVATFVEGAAWCAAPLGLLIDPFAVLVTASAVSGLMTPVWNVNSVGLRQQAVPLHLQARVVALARAAGIGAIPLGTLAGGVVGALLTSMLGERVGLTLALCLGGAVAASSALALVIGRFSSIVVPADAVVVLGAATVGHLVATELP